MITKIKRKLYNEDGFTLIELMIVIAVIGVLAAIAAPKFSGVKDKAKDVNFTSASGTIRSAMEMYYAENGEYPSSITDYSTLDNTLDSVKLPNLTIDTDATDPSAGFSYTNNTNDYELVLISEDTGTTFTITKDSVTSN